MKYSIPAATPAPETIALKGGVELTFGIGHGVLRGSAAPPWTPALALIASSHLDTRAGLRRRDRGETCVLSAGSRAGDCTAAS